MTELEIAKARYYTPGSVIRIVGTLTLERSQLMRKDGTTRFYLRVWRGRALKAWLYYGYKTQEERDKYFDKLISIERASQQEKAAKKASDKVATAQAKLENPFPVGTVFYNMWGYDQTNIDWYEVTEVKGLRLTLRRLLAKSKETGWAQGDCQPDRGNYNERYQPITKIVRIYGGKPYVSAEFGAMTVWDGKSKHWTAYA